MESQIDFNYIEDRQLLEEAKIGGERVSLADRIYRCVIVEPEFATPAVRHALEGFQGTVYWSEKEAASALLVRVHARALDSGWLVPDANLRTRRVLKDGICFLMVFNESSRPTPLPALRNLGCLERWNPADGKIQPYSLEADAQLAPFELGVWTLPAPSL